MTESMCEVAFQTAFFDVLDADLCCATFDDKTLLMVGPPAAKTCSLLLTTVRGLPRGRGPNRPNVQKIEFFLVLGPLWAKRPRPDSGVQRRRTKWPALVG